MGIAPTIAWTKLLGGGSNDYAYSVSTASDGSIYIAGYTEGSIDGQSNNGSYDAFITKFNSDGSKVWTKLLGGGDNDYAHSVSTASDGSIYIAGGTNGSIDGQSNNGSYDPFITKFNSDGSKVWTKLVGGGSNDFARSVSTASDGSIYIAGETYGSIDGQTNNGSNSPDAFITKFNSDGSKVWTKLLGGVSSDFAYEVSTASDGSIYIAGYTNGSIDGQRNNGSTDAFITKFNSDGSKEWTKLLGGGSTDYAQSVSTASDGSIYIAGYTNGSIDGQSNNGGYDAFITKFNSDGSKEWTKLLGAGSYDIARTVSTASDGSIYIAGYTSATIDGETNNGSEDAFITKLNSDGSSGNTKTYTLTPSATTINEGAVLTSTITTTNVATGTKLYYALSGTGITTADFSAGALTGEGVTDGTGKFAITHTLANDLTTEGAESLSIKLYSDTARTLQVGSTATVSIVDTSTTAPLVVRGNSLYTIVDGPSWTQAEANSVKLGGHLVAINHKEENDFVWEKLGTDRWIGLSDEKSEGTWEWTTGEKLTYQNWIQWSFNAGPSEDYAWLWGNNGQWDDNNLTGIWGGSSPNIKGISETPFIRRGDSAYVIVQGPTWEEAEVNAVKLGGHLVTINDATEWSWFKSQFSPANGYAYPESYNYYPNGEVQLWIGLNDARIEGLYEWVSGQTSEIIANDILRTPNDDYGVWQWEQGKVTTYPNDLNISSPNWNSSAKNIRGIAEIKLAPNNTPTGTPTVTGTFKVGSTLTIDATAIKDSDNFTGYTPTFKYNWETSTDGTTWSKLTTTDGADNNNTYILTTAEANKKIRGVVGYLDGYGTNEVVNSAASESIANVTPTHTLTPSLATINEGAIINTSVATTNVATGTKLYYSLSGTGITTADFSAGALTGEGSTDSAGKFTFTHTLANDLTTEGAETLNIKLFTDSARTLQVGSTATVSIADTSLTQVIKDTTPPTIALTTSKASLTAGDQATITFTLSEDATDFTASDITTSSGVTLSDFKGSGKIYTATFTPKANTQAAAVVSVASKTFSDSAGNYNNDEVEANNKITFFIDTVVAPGVKITLPGDLTTDENGKSVVIPLVLKTEPKTAVRLDFLLSKGAEATLSAKTIEFNTTNWSTPQSLTLKGVEDYIDDIDQKYSLTITGSSTDKSYQTSADPKGLQIPVINLINLDDNEDAGADIYGDPGAKPTKDTLNGTEGPDRIYGLLTDDILYGGPGKDLIFGGYGNDILYGEISDDELYGEGENDTLYGGEGNDRLTGGEGFDKLIGGAGNDTYVIDDERDTIDDQGLGTDIDTVLFRANLTTYTMPASIKNAVLDSGSAFKLIGNGLDNNLKGNDNNNEIDGGDGSDVLNGGGGDDLLKGGSGSDTAHYHKQLPGFTFGAEGGAGITANLLTGKASGTEIGNDTLVAIENIETSDGSDTLIGNENANTLIANGGNDLLEANGGNDLLIGGQGDDQLDGGAGDDQAVYSGVRDDYEISQDSTGTKVIIKDKRQFQDGIDTITGIETVKFADKSLVLADLTSKTLDFNGDGNVDSFDSILMMRHMMGTYPGESIKKDIPGKFDLTAIQRKLTNAFADTFSLNGGLRLDIDGDKRISAFRDGMMITQHILKQGTSDSPWAPPGFNPTAGFPAQMQQHLKDLIGF